MLPPPSPTGGTIPGAAIAAAVFGLLSAAVPTLGPFGTLAELVPLAAAVLAALPGIRAWVAARRSAPTGA